MKIPIYNCIIDESVNDESGVYAISFVDSPANEVDFVALNKTTPVFLNKDNKKQILTGVVLKPDQLIYRYDSRGEYYIKFSCEQIEKIAQKMMKTGVALHNTTHQHESTLTGNYLVELWIVENPTNDKSNALGFKDLPKGTLMCSYKVADKTYWDSEVMTGNVKGFSLEGFFFQEINMSKLNKSSMNKKKKNLSLVERLALSVLGVKLSDIDAVEKEDTTDSGDTFREFTLLDGKTVLVDSDNFATMDGEQMQAGEHKLADGNIMIIDENGNFVETKEPSTAVTDPEEATAAQTLKELKHKLAKEKARNKSPQKLADEGGDNTDAETVDSLKAKIAELEAKIAELTGLADEAVKEVENLKKKTPSTPPAVQKVKKEFSEMTKHERIAETLSLTLSQRKK